jgi:hypothetical protein
MGSGGGTFAERLDGWSDEHPLASFGEIEDAVEEQLNLLRAELVQRMLDKAAVRDRESRASVACPECGRTLQSEGHKERRLTVRGQGEVRLRRRRKACPACGAGLFPPRRPTGNNGQ